MMGKVYSDIVKQGLILPCKSKYTLADFKLFTQYYFG